MFLLGIGRLSDEFYLKKKLTAEFYVINFLLSGGNKKEAPKTDMHPQSWTKTNKGGA